MIKNFYITIFIIGATFLLFMAFLNQQSDPVKSNKELIKFSHALHYELVECAECHSVVSESISLNDRLLPNHDNCVDCHDVDDDNECATCHIDDNYEPLIQKKSELIYNHKIHNLQGMQCTLIATRDLIRLNTVLKVQKSIHQWKFVLLVITKLRLLQMPASPVIRQHIIFYLRTTEVLIIRVHINSEPGS
ncbi:MAG: hypothetical protein U5J96_08415 [Ignavibacteriaceae bacterium]|nr:hypothetical protein [Ignavibacteriaceae bacterium]